MNISNHKNTILIIILVLLAFFGYWFFFLSKKEATQSAQANQSLKAQTPVASNTQYDKEFVTSLLGLNSVNLDVSIFQSKVYQALSYPEVPFVVNYSRETGRDNPFLPIGVDPARAQNVQTQTVAPASTTVEPTPAQPATTPKTNPTTPAPTPVPTPKKF